MTNRLRLLSALISIGIVLLGVPVERRRAMVFVPAAEGPRSPMTRMLLRYGNQVADPGADYPASLVSVFDDGVECNATLVGADSVLTSAHCVQMASMSGAEVHIKIKGSEIRALCEAYSGSDLGLCQLSSSVDGILFEVISRDAGMATPRRRVRLTGWGHGWSLTLSWLRNWFRRLRWRLGFGPVFREGPGTIVTSAAELTVDGDFVNGGYVVVEPGDSGGAGYAEQGSTRRIVGVNRCGGKFCTKGATDRTSALANVTYEAAATWIKQWAKDHNAMICGFTTTNGCRP